MNMIRASNKYYYEIREFLDNVPVIETHEHYNGIIEPVSDILGFLMTSYYNSDFMTADLKGELIKDEIIDASRSFDERYDAFESLYKRSRHTAYARAMERGLFECWGIGGITKKSLLELKEKFSTRDQDFYKGIMEKYKIVAMITDIPIEPYVDDGSVEFTQGCRFAFPLPKFHNITTAADARKTEKYIGRKAVTLDDYIEGFEQFLCKAIDFGVVCLKDQTAYRRAIDYSNPSKYEAENIFNKIVTKPRDVFGLDQTRSLDDWLFHRFIKLARSYELPVQIHTGHMAGIRNDIEKTNAIHLTELLELHSEVVFDLFHGNWPYIGELLFLCKNYPNVMIDLCWVQSIDPIYSVELMKRAIMTVPHNKVMAFGGDTRQPEWAVGYLVLARDNIACALSEMIDCGWISMQEARLIASDWMFNNPNDIFKLGFDRYVP